MKLVTSGGSTVAFEASATTLIDGTAVPVVGGGVHLFQDEVTGLVRQIPYSQIYQTNPWLWAVVQLKARSFSRMPPKVFVRDRESGLDLRAREGRGRQLEDRLRRPGMGVSWQARQKATMIDYQVHGNCLWAIQSNGSGITGFELVPWSRVEVKHNDSGDVVYREKASVDLSGASGGREFAMADVIHFGWGENPEGLANCSPIGSLQATLALFDSVYQQILNFFQNGARPSGHFKIPETTTPAQLTAINTTLKAAMSGAKNAGKILVSPGDFQPITVGPDQAKIIELARQSREEICGVFGVAPPLVGILEKAIFSNVKELRNFTMRDTVGPDVEAIAGSVSTQVAYKRPTYSNVIVEFEAAAQLKPDLESVVDTIPNQLRVQTPNELRRKFNMAPLDDPAADLIWSPNSSNADGSENPGTPAEPIENDG